MTTKRPKKPCALTMRMTQELRQHLEEESTRSGRSVSTLAALWMEEGRHVWAKRVHDVERARYISQRLQKIGVEFDKMTPEEVSRDRLSKLAEVEAGVEARRDY